MRDFLSQFQCLLDHDSYSIKDFVDGSIAHECRGGDQLVFDINVCFVHICVDMFAAHLLHDACSLSIRPPEDEERAGVRAADWDFLHSDKHLMIRDRFTHFSHSLSCPTVTSQPGRILAARTGEMQHMPSGFPALWKSLMIFSSCGWMVQSLFFTAQSLRFFATPKPPEWSTRSICSAYHKSRGEKKERRGRFYSVLWLEES